MNSIVNIQLDLMYIILLILILLHANKTKYASEQQERRLFNLHLCAIMVSVIMEAASWFMDSQKLLGLSGVTYFVNLLGFLTNPLPSVTWLLYVYRRLGGMLSVAWPRKVTLFAPIALNTWLCLTNHLTHWYFTIDSAGEYHRSYGFILIYVIIFIYVLWAIALVLRKLRQPGMDPEERRHVRLLIVYPLAPLLGCIIQVLQIGMSTALMGLVVAVCICYIYETLYRLEKIHKLEKELDQSRVAIMMSQIKPHFLYNVLDAIQDLCYTDPQLAAEAVSEFAVYLRGNLDSLTESSLIPFINELQNVENYLSLEKKRFEERLTVVYALDETDFLLPAMTLQPIVENAVRHGVTKRSRGGTITISTSIEDGWVIVVIADDGVGFSQAPSDGRNHVGIENVRNRLQILCGGTLQVDSTQGSGTVVRMSIPKTAQPRI